MRKVIVGQYPVQWTTLTLYTYDDGKFVDVIGEVSNGTDKEWMDSKYDSFFKKAIWPHEERILKMKESALRAYDHCPAQIILMECNEDEFEVLRQ